MRINNKGYMLVEIIVASVLAMSVGYYLINLTYEFKNENMDIYNSANMISDKINITKNIMNDLEGKKVTGLSSGTNFVNLTVAVGSGSETRRIEINKSDKTIIYGKYNTISSNFDTSDSSYYKKTIQSYLEMGNITVDEESNLAVISIPLSNIYSDSSYEIKILVEMD